MDTGLETRQRVETANRSALNLDLKMNQEMNSLLPPKPRWGTPCNGCGLCCAIELCEAGEIAFPGASAPCPGLKLRGDGKSTYCELVAIEIVSGLSPVLQDALGIGKGCSMNDSDEALAAAMDDDSKYLATLLAK